MWQMPDCSVVARYREPPGWAVALKALGIRLRWGVSESLLSTLRYFDSVPVIKYALALDIFFLLKCLQ